MNIFHQKISDDKYNATITSDGPIFATYPDLIKLAYDLGLTLAGIAFCLRHDECPTPINHNDGMDGAPEDGIWVYDRLVAFFDWMANRSAYASMLKGAKSETIVE